MEIGMDEEEIERVVMFKSFYSNLWSPFKLTFFCCSFFILLNRFHLAGCLSCIQHTSFRSMELKNIRSPTDLHIRMNYFWMWEVDSGTERDTFIEIE